jgi:hypothetical protein
MVVTLVVLAILLGMATVAWNWVAAKGHRTEADTVLDRIVALQGPIARDWGRYTDWPGDLLELGDDVTLVPGRDGASWARDEVSIMVGTGGTLALAVQWASGECLYRRVDPLSRNGGQQTVEPEPAEPVGRVGCRARDVFADEPDQWVHAPAPRSVKDAS